MAEEQQIMVIYYKRDDGSSPFEDWMASIKDDNIIRLIYARLKRLKDGHYGTHRNLKGGILELKFNNGLRIYGAKLGLTIIILCAGGKTTKKEQDRDIEKARAYLRKTIEQIKK